MFPRLASVGRGVLAGYLLRISGPIFAELDIPMPRSVQDALGRKGPIVYVAITSAPVELVRQLDAEVAETGAEVIVAGTVHDLSDLAGPRRPRPDVREATRSG